MSPDLQAVSRLWTPDQYGKGLGWGHGRGARPCRPFVLALFVLVLSGGLAGPALAQQQVRGGSSLRLDLGMGQSPPGATVLIPATLKAPDNVDVESVEIRILFPKEKLAFVEARKGVASEAVEAVVTTSVEDAAGEAERSLLKVAIKSAAPGNWLPNGTVADLIFKIAEKVTLNETITLENKSIGTSGRDPGALLDGLRGTDGQVLVDETPLEFSCFFYMH
jgi:hypothetical protein